MPKYYVVSGSHRLVIDAVSPAAAAMALIDRQLAPQLWIYDDRELSDRERRDHLAIEALLSLASTVSVSERGPNRDEAGMFEVPLLLDRWHRLMERLSELYRAAGLPPRRAAAPNAVA